MKTQPELDQEFTDLLLEAQCSIEEAIDRMPDFKKGKVFKSDSIAYKIESELRTMLKKLQSM